MVHSVFNYFQPKSSQFCEAAPRSDPEDLSSHLFRSNLHYPLLRERNHYNPAQTKHQRSVVLLNYEHWIFLYLCNCQFVQLRKAGLYQGTPQ